MPKRFRRNPDTYIATLINPKTRELVEVHRYLRNSVVTQYPGVDDYVLRLGEAYYDPSETFETSTASYVRSHSPAAGVSRGKGYGVVLYAGLCLRAFADTQYHGIGSSDGGSGHSTRSSHADKFWERAVRNGLAEETVVEGESEEKSVRLDDDYRFSDITCEDTGDDDCTDVQSVSGRIDVEYLAGGGEVDAQYMDAVDHLSDSGLLFAASDMNNNDFEFPAPPPEVLAGLDLSGCRDPAVAEDILKRIVTAGLESVYIERALSTMPPDVYNMVSSSKQLRLPYVQNASRRYRPNADVERVLSKVWDEYYGGLQDFPDPDE